MSEPRMVPPDEARRHAERCRERGFNDMAEFWDVYAVLGEQREAVLALHPQEWSHQCITEHGTHRIYRRGEVCPTARALGVKPEGAATDV